MNIKPPPSVPADAICEICGTGFRGNRSAYLVAELDEDDEEIDDKLLWVHKKCVREVRR